MNSEMPFTPGVRLAVGARDLGEDEMHDVLGRARARRRRSTSCCRAGGSAGRAGRTAKSAPSGEASVVMSPRLDPACGSLSAIVPKKRPSILRLGEDLALSRRSVRHEEVGVGVGQHAERVDADAGHREERVRRHVDDVGQLHAADVVVVPGREQARLRVRLQRLGGGGRQVDARAVERGLLGVGDGGCTERSARRRCARSASSTASKVSRVCSANRGRAGSDATSSQSYSRNSRVSRRAAIQ